MSGAAHFLDYGLERAAKPRRNPELYNGGVKAPTALELKLQEKQRLSRGYKAWKRAERRRLIEAEPRLLDLIRYVRKLQVDGGDDLIDAVSVCGWLLNAEPDVRRLALNIIQQRADRINLLLGLPTLSDPIPPELGGTTNVFHECRRLLSQRGPL